MSKIITRVFRFVGAVRTNFKVELAVEHPLGEFQGSLPLHARYQGLCPNSYNDVQVWKMEIQIFPLISVGEAITQRDHI